MANRSVLMVDDSRLARMLLRGLLTETMPGWEILEAESSAQALTILQQRMPEVILIDFNMPGVNGLELCLQLREQWPDLPLYLVTANIQDKLRERAAGHNIGFINKPVSREALLEIIPKDGAS